MRILLPLGLLLATSLAFALTPAFHLPFDGQIASASGVAPLAVTGEACVVEGKVGQAIRLDKGAVLTYPARGVLDKSRGSVSFWLRPQWDGDDGQSHVLLADVSDFNDKSQNTFALWKWSTGQLRLDLRCAADPYVTTDVRHWRAGQWHHIGASWDAAGTLALFVDGQCVGRRETSYEPRAWPRLNVGGDWAGAGSGEAVFDDLRFYSVALGSPEMTAIMAGQPLEDVTVTRVKAPGVIKIGTPFAVRARVTAPQPLTREYPAVVLLDGVEIGRETVDGSRWSAKQAVDLQPLTVTVPLYLRVKPGRHTMTVLIEGAVQPPPTGEAVAATYVDAMITREVGHTHELKDGIVYRDRKPFPAPGQGVGFLYDGVFYTDDEIGRAKAVELLRAGRLDDAFACRVVDAVDCAQEGHSFRQWGRSSLSELLPGRTFRVTGAPETVTEEVDVYGQTRRALPGFAYRLANTPLPRPHVLVAELPNDRERVTEIAIDAAAGSRLASHLALDGPGDTRLINLSTVYTGREYACDGSVLRHCLLFYPKSDACEVTVTSSGHQRKPAVNSGAAVSRLAVYELLDDEAAMYNEVRLPLDQATRSVSLFFPEHRFLYTQWGFSGVGDGQRRASLLSLFDYMKFMGANRLEFHPVAFGMTCAYNGGALPNAQKYDVFDDLLPLAEERRIEVIPTLDGLAFYDQSPEFTDESFQLDRDGQSVRKYFGRVPDPLRPEVQARLFAFLSEFLEKTRNCKAVPAVAFKVDGKMGTCYSGDAVDRPAEDAGYSEWDIAQYERATGVTVGGTPGDTPSRYEWLRADPARWARWQDWRCTATRDFWLKARDLVVSRGKDRLLIKTILPDNYPGNFNFWQKRDRSPLEVLRGHGYDPRLYAQEKGLRFTRCLLVGSDRYFGAEANKSWQYDEHLQDAFQTAEGSETELYFVYWELPDHPCGFRVGPSSGPGRAFFEPLTHTVRLHNPYNITFYNWYAGTIGHELDLRRFVRAYRALPAVQPVDFEGEIFPHADGVCARWYGDRLAIINDTDQPRSVRLTFDELFPRGTCITDLATGATLWEFAGKSKSRLEVPLQAWDMTTLEIKRPGGQRRAGGRVGVSNSSARD